MFTDTHAHLFFENYKDDIDDVITRAKENGIDTIYTENVNDFGSYGFLKVVNPLV